MSVQYTFEIENFNAGQNLVVDIDYALFPQFSHIPIGTAGSTTKTAEQAKKITVFHGFDKNSNLFIAQVGKSFPKATLRITSSGSEKSYVFTFSEVFLDYFNTIDNGSNQLLDEIKFSFDKFSVKEDSPVGSSAKPKKTSDRRGEQIMNYLKN